jgi:hypothetical protein
MVTTIGRLHFAWTIRAENRGSSSIPCRRNKTQQYFLTNYQLVKTKQQKICFHFLFSILFFLSTSRYNAINGIRRNVRVVAYLTTKKKLPPQ